MTASGEDLEETAERRRRAEAAWAEVLRAIESERDDESDMERALRGEPTWRAQLEARVRADMVNLRCGPSDIYDPDFGDGRECACGHEYYRHFDSYEGMSPVGCKYCGCGRFQEPAGGAGA